jgi:hypothetical protein
LVTTRNKYVGCRCSSDETLNPALQFFWDIYPACVKMGTLQDGKSHCKMGTLEQHSGGLLSIMGLGVVTSA